VLHLAKQFDADLHPVVERAGRENDVSIATMYSTNRTVVFHVVNSAVYKHQFEWFINIRCLC
jgi:hypothetical protein